MDAWRRAGAPLGRAGSVLTIHNQSYQGYSHASALGYLGLGPEYFTADALESGGKINLLKGGMAFADAITTVSPTYAKEILAEPGGNGLSAHLNKRAADFTVFSTGGLRSVESGSGPADSRALPGGIADRQGGMQAGTAGGNGAGGGRHDSALRDRGPLDGPKRHGVDARRPAGGPGHAAEAPGRAGGRRGRRREFIPLAGRGLSQASGDTIAMPTNWRIGSRRGRISS